MTKGTVETPEVQEAVEVKEPKAKKAAEVKPGSLGILEKAAKAFSVAAKLQEDQRVLEAKQVMEPSATKAKIFLDELAKWEEQHKDWLQGLRSLDPCRFRGRVKEQLIWNVTSMRQEDAEVGLSAQEAVPGARVRQAERGFATVRVLRAWTV